MSSSVGLRIKKLRQQREWSLRELEKRTGINYSVLSRIESGVKSVDDNKLNILANVFDVSVDYLLGRTKDPNPWVSKDSEPEDEFDPIREINKLLKKYGIESSGFFDIEQWKAMGPEDIEKLESYFKFIAEEARKRNQQDDADSNKS